MRFDVKKFIVIGPSAAKEDFFKDVQKEGIAEFVEKEGVREKAQEVELFTEALRILRSMPSVKQTPQTPNFHSPNVLARHVVERFHALEKLREERRILEKEISRVEVFGNFSVEELKEIEREGHRYIQFFYTKSKEEHEVTNPHLIYITSHHEMDYYLSIAKERMNYPGFVEILIERSLSDLQAEMAHVRRQIDEFESELAQLTHSQSSLQEGLTHALNHFHLEKSKDQTDVLLEGKLFAAEAWVPKNKIHILEALTAKHHVYLEKVKPNETDRVPTYLENKGPARLGEDLIRIYDVPSTEDRDPSLWVFFAFGLFFSMIVADAGYGLLLLGISLFLFYKFGKRNQMLRRVLLLSNFLAVGCIIWGVLTASYLGIDVPMDSPLRKVSIFDWMVKKKMEYVIGQGGAPLEALEKHYPAIKGLTDPHEIFLKATKLNEGRLTYELYQEYLDNIMLELVIFIGMVHIILSFLRNIDKNWAGAGWILFLIGGYLYFPLSLKQPLLYTSYFMCLQILLL